MDDSKKTHADRIPTGLAFEVVTPLDSVRMLKESFVPEYRQCFRDESDAWVERHRYHNFTGGSGPVYCATLDLVRLADGSLWVHVVPCGDPDDDPLEESDYHYPRLVSTRQVAEMPLIGVRCGA